MSRTDVEKQYEKKWRIRNRDKMLEYRRRSYKKNNEERRAYQREYELRKYGISGEIYSKMVEAQESKCAICHKFCPKLFVDHNHTTGEVRKLLCSNCNTAIGLAYEDHTILENMIAYLKSFPSSFEK